MVQGNAQKAAKKRAKSQAKLARTHAKARAKIIARAREHAYWRFYPFTDLIERYDGALFDEEREAAFEQIKDALASCLW